MRVTFVYPDHESLGIQYLMAAADSQGHETRLVHYNTGENFHDNSLARPSDIIRRLKHAGPDCRVDASEIARTICETRPDLIAFSCVTDNFAWQMAVAAECKHTAARIPTIVGGIHATSLPFETLRRPEVDAIAIGEADISFIEFLGKCKPGDPVVFPDEAVQGIIFKKGQALVGREAEGPLANLESLPYPSKLPWMSRPGLESVLGNYKIITSRGCPYACSYCFNSIIHSMRGRRLVRRRSVANVVGELVAAWKANPHLTSITFWDDCLATNMTWLREFKEVYMKEVNLPFTCRGIPENLTEGAIHLLKEMGCCGVQIGVQSLSEQMHEEVFRRRFDAAKVAQVIRSLNEKDIPVWVDQILGAPHDTVENQEKALLFYNEHRPSRVNAVLLSYYPRTEISKTAMETGYLTPSEYEKICSGGSPGERGFFSFEGRSNSAHLDKFISCFFLFKYTPLLPRWLVRFLVRTRLYRVFRVRNYILGCLLPDYIKVCGGFGGFLRACKQQFLQGRMRADPIPAEAAAQVSVVVLDCPSRVSCGRRFEIKIKVVNNSQVVLSSHPPYPVRIGYHWVDTQTGEVVVYDGQRTVLAPVLKGRSEQTYGAQVFAPMKKGNFRLEVRLVQEMVRWFEACDVPHDRDRVVAVA